MYKGGHTHLSNKVGWLHWKTGIRQSNAVTWLKWVAVVAMFVDHLRFGLEGDQTLYYAIGRIAYPMFALLCGWNALFYTKSIFKYATRIALLGVILEFVHILLHFTLDIEKPNKLNPILTLAIGVAFIGIVQQRRNLLPFCILLLLPIELYFSYGILGSILPVLTYLTLVTPIWLPFLIINAFLLDTPWQLGTISALGVIVGLCLLRVGMLKCPLPNNRYLYIAFPLSFLPPAILSFIK